MRKTALSLTAAAFLAGAAALYLVDEANRDSQADPADRDRQIVQAAVARIKAESRGKLPPPAVEAAPGTGGLPKRTNPQAGQPPLPPQGYSFVDFHGEMPKARVVGAGSSAPEAVDDGLNWLGSPSAVAALARQAAAAKRDWSYGWIRLAADSTPNALAHSLEGTGATIVGSSGRLFRARLPGDATHLQEIAALPAVDGLGAAPPEAKLRAFADDVLNQPAHEQTPVYISLMTADAGGRWRRALENLGAVVGSYDPALRVYTATVTHEVLNALAAADFVLAVEPIGIVKAAHDTAVPALGADALRSYGAAPGIFSGSGGASVPIAVMDTGLNINHLDIATNRDSICGANFAWNAGWFGADGPLYESEDLWIDGRGHGTHVTGTIAGNGTVQPRFAGMAPSVAHIRFAKVLDLTGSGFGDGVRRGMEYVAETSGCSEQGRMSERVKPLIVNMSLSARSLVFDGRDVGPRKLDSSVWSHRQLYVVAQSNADIHGFSNYGAAKNSLAVGATLDSGDLAWFSSHGPTADGRLAPNLVASGVGINSALGNGSRGGYRKINGTSMSSPATAGVAALLMDAVPAHREQPALTRARLMASAIRPDAWLADAAAFPLDNSGGPGALQAQYGMGQVSARTSALQRDQADGWQSGSATSELRDGEYAWQDIVVPEGASRLDLVMTWDEPPADAIANTVLNDLDLWLDRDADCESQACGEHVSASRIDNVEWIIVTDPQPGTYRAKVLAHRVYTDAPRAALAWTVIRGASAPNLQIEADRESLAAPGKHELTLTLTSDAYVSAGTRLHIDCRAAGGSPACDSVTFETMAVSREDGVTVDLTDDLGPLLPSGHPPFPSNPINLGASIPLGEVAAGESQEVSFTVSTGAGSGRLHFTASAWNATGASVSVDLGTPGSSETAPAKPANDDFATAIVLEGEEGSRALDLLLATPEPGEPAFSTRQGRPAGSVWYIWTAPASGSFNLNIPHISPGDTVARNDRVDVYAGETIATLEPVASGLWGVTLFAEQGETYRIRVSNFSSGAAMNLRWSLGGRPENDNFAAATQLEGESGDQEGSRAGATLEPDESLGRLAETVWFRWTAPGDGDWSFSVPHPGRVLAFQGDSLAALRLVSGLPATVARFAAGEGTEYRIAVAAEDTDSSGGSYRLRWSARERQTGNDWFADADSMGEAASSRRSIGIDYLSTVEPDEPEETGVRTKWWKWVAPADDLYTWRLEDRGETVPTFPKLQVSVFSGTSIDNLQLAAEMGPGAPFELLLDATGTETYWFAAGLPARDVSAFEQRTVNANLTWGPTPNNDEVANARALSGTSGSFQGSNRYATSSRGHRTSILGRSSLWFTYEAPGSGWVRFSVDGSGGPWVLSVHQDATDGFGGLETVASSQWQRANTFFTEVFFQVTAGKRYTIALGSRLNGRGGPFTLRWRDADAPVWLRYAGRLVDGQRDSRNNPIEIRTPGDLALHDSGEAVYLASALGLQVFERTPATGELNFLQLLDIDRQGSSLIWDAPRTRLLANQCRTWRRFAPGSGLSLEDEGELTVSDNPGTCGGDLFMDPGGSFLYRVASGRVDLFAVEETGGLRFVQAHEAGGLKRALISNGGGHVYAVTNRSLLTFTRNAESGALTRAEGEPGLSWAAEALAISDDDAHLFVFDDYGKQTRIYQLEDPSSPQSLDTLPRFWDRRLAGDVGRCRFAAMRVGASAVDIFCHGSAFAVEWRPSTEALDGTDFISDLQADRFNNEIPDFGSPRDIATSGDGEHVYLSTPSHGILIFARGVTRDDEQSGDADLVIDSTTARPANLAPGESFTLHAAVKNQGDGRSAATTLRFYRSGNSIINTGRFELGSVPVPRVSPSATSLNSLAIEARPSPGTYYYGACVDTLSDESDTENNCSSAVTVTVSSDGG